MSDWERQAALVPGMKRAAAAVAALALVGGSVSLATAIPPSDPDPELVFIPVPHPEAPRPAETATPTLAPAVEVVRGGDTGFPQWDTVGAERLHPLPTPASRHVAPAVLAPQPAQVFTPAAGPIRGAATWYCRPGVSRCTRGFAPAGAFAAAGPELRSALGKHWRGRFVRVNGIRVRLIDWCACGGDHVIDVYWSTWRQIPHPGRVRVTW